MRNPAQIAFEIEEHLFPRFLDRWFPLCVDPAGGFRQTFARDWSPAASTQRGVVFQARMVWTAATIAEAYPAKTEYRGYLRHGLSFLADSLWDQRHGGFFWSVADEEPLSPAHAYKRTYGQAFGLFALAAAARVLDELELVEWVSRAFDWIEAHAYDESHGGWLELLQPDGSPIQPGQVDEDIHGFGQIATYDVKLQNTHLHVMEALIEAHPQLSSPLVAARLSEAVKIMLDRMFVEPGCLHTTFHADWTPLPAAWSIGHDIEASHLLRAANRIVREPGVERVCSMLLRHCLDRGFDWDRGGIYEMADAVGPVWDRRKGWWNQFEALAALAVELEQGDRADPRAWDAFVRTWDWIRDKQFDPKHGGVYGMLTEAGELVGDGAKGHAWKAAYHETRAMLLSIRALRGLP